METYRKPTNLIARNQVTELLLQQHLRTWKSPPKYIIENLFVFDWESDMLICTRSGYWYEVECKISLTDFKNDFIHKRQKHEFLKTGGRFHHRRPNYFYYCVPWYLSEKVLPLLPEYAGLLVLREDGKLDEIKRAPCLHKKKHTAEDLHLCDKFYYAYRNWKRNLERMTPTAQIRKLQAMVDFVKAEYKAATGHDIKDVLDGSRG